MLYAVAVEEGMSEQKRWWGPGIKSYTEWSSILGWGYDDYLELRCLICHEDLAREGADFPVQVTCSPECEAVWMLRHA
jgi:hypothetical protein